MNRRRIAMRIFPTPHQTMGTMERRTRQHNSRNNHGICWPNCWIEKWVSPSNMSWNVGFLLIVYGFTAHWMLQQQYSAQGQTDCIWSSSEKTEFLLEGNCTILLFNWVSWIKHDSTINEMMYVQFWYIDTFSAFHDYLLQACFYGPHGMRSISIELQSGVRRGRGRKQL